MKELVKEIFPPDVPPTLRWRLAVFGAFVVTFLHIAWAWGVFAILGPSWAGFAKASDLKDEVAKVTTKFEEVHQVGVEIKTSLLEKSAFDAKDSECTSTDPAAKRFFQLEIAKLNREYYRLTRTPLNLPPCKEKKDTA